MTRSSVDPPKTARAGKNYFHDELFVGTVRFRVSSLRFHPEQQERANLQTEETTTWGIYSRVVFSRVKFKNHAA